MKARKSLADSGKVLTFSFRNFWRWQGHGCRELLGQKKGVYQAEKRENPRLNPQKRALAWLWHSGAPDLCQHKWHQTKQPGPNLRKCCTAQRNEPREKNLTILPQSDTGRYFTTSLLFVYKLLLCDQTILNNFFKDLGTGVLWTGVDFLECIFSPWNIND